MSFDNSFDKMDITFDEFEENYWDDIWIQEELRKDRERRQYIIDRRKNTGTQSRREGVDEAEAPPLWWIEQEGRKALEETFAGDDDDHPDNRKPIQRFRFFRQNVRANNWF